MATHRGNPVKLPFKKKSCMPVWRLFINMNGTDKPTSNESDTKNDDYSQEDTAPQTACRNSSRHSGG